MAIPRYYTVGAVVPDSRTLESLADRLWAQDLSPSSVVAVSRRTDRKLVGLVLPEAEVYQAESGLSRMQWTELASTYIGVTAVSVLLGAIHPPTGIIVQAVLTLAVAIGLLIYHHTPQLESKLLGMGMPERLASEWAQGFSSGSVLVLVTVPEEMFEEVQEAFEEEKVEKPLAVDRRLVL